ncbi:MAG: hypothetical protein Q9211_005592 [Gyalolechia sp. 1 TL-2023]
MFYLPRQQIKTLPQGAGSYPKCHLRVETTDPMDLTDIPFAPSSKAQEEVEGWIKSSKKGSYTPVDAEHHWSEGRSFLTIKPEHDGYLLGDLDKYLASMVAFHTRYGGFWAWEAQLLKKGFMGVLIARGSARLQTR